MFGDNEVTHSFEHKHVVKYINHVHDNAWVVSGFLMENGP